VTHGAVPAHARALTSLRFLAALWVLLHHALPRADGRVRGAVGETGWLGVSLFFVLSGFLLTVRYAPEGTLRVSTRGFWLERVARLAPTYLLALAFALPLFARDARVHELGAERVAAVVVSVLTVQQSWRPELACQWDCPAWSLSVETWFYLAFPLLIGALGTWMMRGRARGLVLALAALAASVMIFPWLERVGGGWPLPIYSLSPLARWPEFVAGIGLAGLMRDWRPRGAATGLGLFAAGVVWLIVTVALRDRVLSDRLHLLPFALPGFVLLVAGCWALRGHAAAGLDSAWLVLLGEASYALYLFHAPLHGYVLALANRVVGRGYDGHWLLFGVYLTLALALSVAVHRLFELPWRGRLRARFGTAQRAG
jgi:peptidoglycan/LPS O-acetylase OafA/YrhL